VISSHILPRERELSLENGQKCIFLIMAQSCVQVAVENIPRKHCVFSTYLANRARAQSGSCAEVQFPDYGTVLWSLVSTIDSRKHGDFSIYIAKRASDQSDACAGVQFPNYGTVLWSTGNRNSSRKPQ
jgi:hypothetical protein